MHEIKASLTVNAPVLHSCPVVCTHLSSDMETRSTLEETSSLLVSLSIYWRNKFVLRPSNVTNTKLKTPPVMPFPKVKTLS